MSQTKEEIVYRGKILAIVNIHHPNGEVWEIARRSPGVRVIIKNTNGTYKLSNEFRQEHGKRDIRLAGGKVFDKLDEYLSHQTSGSDILEAARDAAISEAAEELGIANPKNVEFIEKSVLGTTVEWDLYVFELSEFEQGKPRTHGMEDIESINLTKDQIISAIESGEFNEDRIVPVLLRYLKNQ